ncbi:hypothetical protein [Edaphobacter albus]|uniref:hypothetical protein n=1 Tax=Edaphobacter sp. 4G125 TaxID=2763071 RepID=UPI0016471088|nr:hypothetical protein [Edaphobacter sp. 4G125]QNI37491.1 hypothetical protein H7846_04095 [Edaphobacter sp. 4G125]
MAKLFHWRIDVAAELKRKDEELTSSFVGDGGVPLAADKIRVDLTTLLETGVRYLPADSRCDCFDPRRGCIGHDLERAEVAA